MPMFIYDPTLIDRLAAIEGADWAQLMATATDPYSVSAYLSVWFSLATLAAVGYLAATGGDGTIHGAGGNRYRVTSLGSLVIEQSTARSALDLSLASDLGIPAV